jgi:putative redox protein
MKVRVKWVEGMTFLGETENNHAVIMDTKAEFGGNDRGPNPMQMLLLGVGGCTSIDVVQILRKQRQDVRDCVAEIEAERADEAPRVFTRIHIHFVVRGRGVKADKVHEAIRLSAEKYCSASIMLGKTAAITHDFEIVESA